MTALDQMVLALVGWKENRGGGILGMQSVMNVVLNRCAQDHTAPYAEIYKPFQFSSMTYARDPQLLIQPAEDDPEWEQAQNLAVEAASGTLADLTGGATQYYAESMVSAPSWAAAFTPTVTIAKQKFFKPLERA